MRRINTAFFSRLLFGANKGRTNGYDEQEKARKRNGERRQSYIIHSFFVDMKAPTSGAGWAMAAADADNGSAGSVKMKRKQAVAYRPAKKEV